MDLTPEKIFFPSVGCDLIVDSSSLAPKILPTIIYETDIQQKTITISDPGMDFTPDTEWNQLHLTTILSTKKRKIRLGLACKPTAFLPAYGLAGKDKVKAVVLSFHPQPVEINIRSAFRLVLDTRHTTQAKLVCRKNEFFSPDHFRVRDISITGAGLLIPKNTQHGPNLLLGLTKNEPIAIGMRLVDTVKNQFKGPLALVGRIQRVYFEYSETASLVAVRFLGMDTELEDILSEFIHSAQIHQLRKFSE
ncbi:MAG: hypothetical protein CSA18_04695 [Deltaproteobacteria bacterium]|nr:MAG: hypothetical protein CSA18_04695 [Deltaproteobacteria bacterium]